MDIEILKEQNNLTIDENGLIFVKPIGNGDYITYPIEDLGGCLTLNVNDYLLLRANYYTINDDMTGLIVKKLEKNEMTEEEYLEGLRLRGRITEDLTSLEINVQEEAEEL